jgi:hypothetical protein
LGTVSHEKGVERERRTHEDTTEEKVSHEKGVESDTVTKRALRLRGFPMKRVLKDHVSKSLNASGYTARGCSPHKRILKKNQHTPLE